MTLKEIIDGLYDHQKDAIEWCKERQKESHTNETDVLKIGGGILCLTMGLGKTRSMLVLSQLEKNNKTLIICSKTLLDEWCIEIKKIFDIDVYSGELVEDKPKVLLFHQEFSKNIKNMTVEDILKYDIILTTYDVVSKGDAICSASEDTFVRGFEGLHKDKIVSYKRKTKPTPGLHGQCVLFSIKWDHIITDESQKFCNDKTKVFRAVCALVGKYKWCLTGTPCKNADKDMWSLLWFCGFDIVDNPKDWKYNTFHRYNLYSMLFVKQMKDVPKITESMPKITYNEHKVDLSKDELHIYLFYFRELWEAYNKGIINKGNGESFAIILGLFQRLRQISIAPYLLSEKSKSKYKGKKINEEDVPPTSLMCSTKEYIRSLEKKVHDENIMGFQSAKISKILEITKELIKTKEKVLIFSSFSCCLYLLHGALMKDTNVSILDGTTSAKRRSEILNIFRHTDEIQILLCNFKVGAEGLNLTQACNVITIEPHWNHVLENQAISRVWRNGQERPVNVHRIITNGTIENQIVKLCNEKKSVMNSYLNNNATGRQKISKLDYYTLNKILTSTINEYVNKGINIHDYK